MVDKTELQATKERLGPIEVLGFYELSLKEGYRKLGLEVRDVARRYAESFLDRDDAEMTHKKLGFGEQCVKALVAKMEDCDIPQVKTALSDYMTALKSWSDAIDFSSIDHPAVAKLLEEGRTTEEANMIIGLSLQNDNVGCVSGLMRGEDGEILFWHNEEIIEDEPGERVDKARIVRLNGIGGREYYSFVYPDLLPGAGFSFARDIFISVDAQHTTEDQEPRILANTATWVISYLGNAYDPYETLNSLAPFVDGYVINYARIVGQKVLGGKVEFALDTVGRVDLPSNTGEYLISTNIYTQDGNVAVAGREEISPEALEWNIDRQGLSHRSLHLMELLTKRTAPTTEDLSRLLAFTATGLFGEDKAYANKDVKANVVGSISTKGVQISVSAGPALKGEERSVFNF